MSPRISVSDGQILIHELEVADADLAHFVAQAPEGERPGLVARAVKIGLIALCNAGVTVNVDFVQRQFERLLAQMQQTNERAESALEATLRNHFADGEGRLPQTLEAFLGDRGKLRQLIGDLFDDGRRDSAIGRMRDLLGRYFEGDGAVLATLLDPTRQGSALYQFRNEVTTGFKELGERLAALEAGNRARAEERARSAAKGGDFEDVIELHLAALAHGAGDILERTSDTPGAVMGSKKGDLVLTLDPAQTRGADLRIVIEAKDRAISRRQMAVELREARENRSASAAVVVFTPQHAPSGIAPLQLVGTDVYCVLDPDDDEPVALEAAVRLARALALATLRQVSVEIDVAAVQGCLDDIRQQVAAVQGMKSVLTSIGTKAKEVSGGLDELRAVILRRVVDVESELRVVTRAEDDRLSA